MATTFTTSTNGTILVVDGITYQYSSADNSWTRVAQPLNGTSSTFTVTNVTSATSTNTGAFQVRGGVGIGGALYVGTDSYIAGAQILTTASVNQYANQTSITAGTDTAVSGSTGAITIWNTSTLQTVTGRGATTTNAISFTNPASSTSTTTGAVVITGGLGVGENLNVGRTITANTLSATTASFVNLNISGSTVSNSIYTGALTVSGGLGVQGNINVGGTLDAVGLNLNGQSVGYGYSGSVGPQGPIGYTGSKSTISGPQGPLGFTGSGGYLGSTGFTGYTGSTGTIGFAGSRGFDGSRGATGFCGSNGYWGSIGATGYTGSRGDAGTSVTILGSVSIAAALPGYPSSYTGAIGDGYIVTSTGHLFVWTGSAWSDVGLIVGPQGPLGYTGSVGVTGPQGSLGFTGSGGYLGSSGATGYTGSTGTIGFSGSRGFDGSRGATGFCGSVGAQGPQGCFGYTGSTGTVGYTGSVGIGTTGTTSTFVILNTTSSTSTNTGALQVRGGAGIAGAVYIGTSSYIAGALIITTATVGLYAAASAATTGTTSTFIILNTTSSTGTSTGALQVRGGAGIAGDLYVGGNIVDSTGRIIGQGTTGTTSTFIILNTTSSTGTSTGALQVRGGVGIGGDLWIGGNIYGSNGQAIGAATTGTTSTFIILNTTSSTGTSTGALQVRGGAGIAGDLYVGGNIVDSTGRIIGQGTTGTTSTFLIANATISTSTNTGALQVWGGVGVGGSVNIGGTLNVGSTASAGSITGVSSIVATNITVTGNLSAPNLTFSSGTFLTPVIVANTSSSTSTNTGALQVYGGAGIGGDVYIGKSLIVGTTASAGSISGVSSISAQNVTVTGNLTAPNLNFSSGTFVTPVIVSNSTTSISTQTGAVIVSGGMGVGGTVFANSFVTQGGLGSISCVAYITTLNLTATNTILVSGTTNSTSTNSGALVVTGGVGIGGNLYISGNIVDVNSGIAYGVVTTGTTSTFVISNTTNSTSTNSGALQVSGGAGIGKDLYVSGTIYAGGYSALTSGSITTGTTSTFVILNTTSSTSTTTGALQVRGGVGIGGQITAPEAAFTRITTYPVGSNANLLMDPDGTGDVFFSTATHVVIFDPQTSTSTTTGALVVTGGVGIGGDLYVGGNITANQLTIQFTTVTTTIIQTDDIIRTFNTTASTGTTTGALQIAGGVGIGGAVYIGTASFIAGAQIITTATIGLYAAASAASTGSTGTFVISSTASTTSTNSGALQVVGGVGVGGGLYVGGVITATSIVTSGAAGSGYITGAGFISATTATITGANASTSTNTGALIVTGGLGVGGNINFGGSLYQNGVLFTGGGATTGTTTTFVISNITSSTSTATGALQVYGGVGVGGNLNVGGNIVGGGVRNSSTSTAPTNPTVGDIWYNPTTDIIARYTSDGANSYWLDVAGPTVSGLTVQNTSVYANSFNGTSQYLTVPSNAAFNFGTGDFTIEGWVYPTSTSGTRPIVEIRTTSGGATGFALLSQSGATTLNVYTNGGFAGASTNSLTTNQWNHVALVRSGNTWTYWINGVSGGSFTNSSTQSDGATTGPKIGGSTTAGEVWIGYLSNIRIIKGTALYTAAFTVPTAPLTAITNTSLLTCQTIPPTDASSNAFAVTNVGGVGLSLYSAQQTSAAINTNSPIILPDASQFSTANSFGMRNRLINGAMTIDQRNAGTAQTITAAAALAYTVDRWYAYSTGANVTGQRVAGAGALQYVYQFTGAASVSAIGFAQRIEAVNSYDLNGTTVTLSAFISNSLLSTVTWTAYYANTADTFGTLASPTRTQIATGSWTVTSSLARYTTNIVVPVAATTGIEIVFSVGAQISGTWQMGGIQLESGTVATPVERRPVTTELALCQRYLQVYKGSDTVNPASNAYTRIGYGPATGTSTGIAQIKPLVTLRVIPGITTNGSFALYDGVSIPTISAPTLDTASTPYSVLLAYGGATGLTATRAYELIINNSQTAYLWLTAEL